MDNDNSQLAFLAGPLPKDCYSSANELIQDFVKVLRVPNDTATIIKGAEGKAGKSIIGNPGPKGDKGEKGDMPTLIVRKIDIALGATYVDFPIFDGYEKASYHIHHKGLIGSVIPEPPAYNPAVSGIVGIGTIIGIAPSVAFIRVFFLFGGGITSVPDDNHVLHITSTTPI